MEDTRLSICRLAMVSVRIKMKITRLNPPRKFLVGAPPQITLSDCGSIKLNPDEQITFLTDKKQPIRYCQKRVGFLCNTLSQRSATLFFYQAIPC